MKNALNNQVGMLGDMFLWLIANLKQGVIYFIKQACGNDILASVYQAVIRPSLCSCLAVIRETSGSHHAAIIQPSCSCHTVVVQCHSCQKGFRIIRQTSGHCHTVVSPSAIFSGGAGVARAPPEFGGSGKGRSLIAAYRSLAFSTNTPRFKMLNTVMSGSYQAIVRQTSN